MGLDPSFVYVRETHTGTLSRANVVWNVKGKYVSNKKKKEERYQRNTCVFRWNDSL